MFKTPPRSKIGYLKLGEEETRPTIINHGSVSVQSLV